MYLFLLNFIPKKLKYPEKCMLPLEKLNLIQFLMCRKNSCKFFIHIFQNHTKCLVYRYLSRNFGGSTSGTAVTLKTGRRELPGSNPDRACRPRRSEFSVVFSETRVNTGQDPLERPPRRALHLYAQVLSETIGLNTYNNNNHFGTTINSMTCDNVCLNQ